MRSEKKCEQAFPSNHEMYSIPTRRAELTPLPSSTRNRHLSPFCRLPAEVRNTIYAYVLGSRTFHFADAIHRHHAKLTPSQPHLLSILRVSHQIYAEASLLPYSLNVFSFREMEISCKPFLDHRLVAQFRAIAIIELVTYRAVCMWAVPLGLTSWSRDLKFLVRLPNLREVRVVVDWRESLYAALGDGPSNAWAIDMQKKLEYKIGRIREDVVVRFF
jgi:hypothetical protein